MLWVACVGSEDNYQPWEAEITRIEVCENKPVLGYVCEQFESEESQKSMGTWFFEGPADSQLLIDHHGNTVSGIGFSKSVYAPANSCQDAGETCWLFSERIGVSNQAGTCITYEERFIDLSDEGEQRRGYLEERRIDDQACGTNRTFVERYRVVLHKMDRADIEQVPEPVGVF